MTATSIEREFAGRVRVLDLRNDHSPTGLLYEQDGTTLAELVRLVGSMSLGAGHVRHVLVHGLCQGRMRNLIAAQDLVDAEMSARPFAELMPLAVEVITAAYGGAER